ncbi:MAG: hypothetical protein KHW79_06120 [Clostridiales bacterium]|nr:hypothetical protein [Clostridiales bacterium]
MSNNMTLYQKSPTRNVQLGMAISLLTLSILFYFEKFALGNSFFQFCEANQFLSSIDAFRNLIFFPYRFINRLFLFYWMNRYINKEITDIGHFQLGRSIAFASLISLLNLSIYLAKNVLPLLFSPLDSTIYRIVLSAYEIFIGYFLSIYVFYKGLGAKASVLSLRLGAFIKEMLLFIKKKLLFLFGFMMVLLVFYFCFFKIILYITDQTAYPISEYIFLLFFLQDMLMIVSYIIPWMFAKLYTSFAEFFVKKDE